MHCEVGGVAIPKSHRSLVSGKTGLKQAVAVQGAVTNAWWDGPYYHPRTWEVADISADLLSNLRKTNNGFAPNDGVKCTSQEALQSVRAMLPPSKALDRPKGRRRMLMRVGPSHQLCNTA